MRVGKVILVALFALIGSAHGVGSSWTKEAHCTKDNNDSCRSDEPVSTPGCTAEWGAIKRINDETQALIQSQLQISFRYLLMSSDFNQWKNQRPGFAKYYSKLSDQHWDETMALLIHFVERGGKLGEKFSIPMDADQAQSESGAEGLESPDEDSSFIDKTELQSLSHALDIEKWLAHKTLHLAHSAVHCHTPYSRPSTNPPLLSNRPQTQTTGSCIQDFEFADFLSDQLQENSVLRIKHLANNYNLLKNIIREKQNADYAVFKFDAEYLK